MTWTYDGPSGGEWATTRDRVRFLATDTVESPQSISDEEIEALEAELAALYGSPVDPYTLAAEVASAMADRFDSAAMTTSKTVGNSSLARTFADRGRRFRDLADRLRQRGSGVLASRMGRTGGTVPERVFRLRQFESPETL
jgi:hypothetical protein